MTEHPDRFRFNCCKFSSQSDGQSHEEWVAEIHQTYQLPQPLALSEGAIVVACYSDGALTALISQSDHPCLEYSFQATPVAVTSFNSPDWEVVSDALKRLKQDECPQGGATMGMYLKVILGADHGTYRDIDGAYLYADPRELVAKATCSHG